MGRIIKGGAIVQVENVEVLEINSECAIKTFQKCQICSCLSRFALIIGVLVYDDEISLVTVLHEPLQNPNARI